MNQIEAYLNEVKLQLSTISKADAKASYDTGYGLHIVNTHLGDETNCMNVIAHSILKIEVPKDIQGEDWYTAWSKAVKMVNRFCKQS